LSKTALILLCFMIQSAIAQNVERLVQDAKGLLKQDPISLQGGINASAVFYNVKGIDPRRDPFYWSINSNLNITLLGKISCPLTFTITQQDKKFTHGLDKFSQPFNQFGLSPNYKWLTVHMGYRSMNFSDYTMNGTLFLGGGIEIKPEKGIVSASVGFGRLMKAVPKGGVEGVMVSYPAYERWGGAAKLRIGKEKHHIELIYFNGFDNKNSIAFDTANRISPSENQIFGVQFGNTFFEKLKIQGSYHLSILNPNTFLPEQKFEKFTYLNKIFTPRANTQINSAYNFQIDYELKGYTIGAKFKRIDPDYASLGSPFIANDIQEYALSLGKNFKNNLLVLNGSIGLQENNLDKKQIATQRKIAGSLMVGINVVKNLNINLSYSNFSSNVVALYDIYYDSIRFAQLNETGNIMLNYSLGKDIRHTFSVQSTLQKSSGNKQETNTLVLINPGYNIQLQPQNIGFVLGLNISQNETAGIMLFNMGPTFGINSSLLNKKIKLNSSFSFQQAKQNKVLTNQNFSIVAGINYSITKSQSFRINYAFIQRKAVTSGAQDFIENRMTLTYSYNFNTGYKQIKTYINNRKNDK